MLCALPGIHNMTLSSHQNPDPLFPPDILSQEASARPWRVAHTKSRREKALAHYLANTGIGYYLPLYRHRQAGGKRIRFSLIPLFSGYLFFRGDDVDRHKAIRSNHVTRIIDVVDEKKLIHELRQIEKVLTSDRGADVYLFDFIRSGQWVRVKDGPLKGVEGQVVRKDREYRLVLSVEMIMQSISVTIDSALVEPMR